MGQTRATVAVFNESTGWRVPQSFVDRLEAVAGVARGDLVVDRVAARHELAGALPSTHALIGYPLHMLPDAATAPELRWIALTESAGERLADLQGALSRDIAVTHAGHFRAPQVAEHAMSLLLALVRRLDVAMVRQSEHDWASADLARQIGTLNGKAVGVLASGAIGQAIAQRLKAFGTRVLATRRDPTNPYLSVDHLFPISRLDELLAEVDALVVALPRLQSTRGLIDAKRLGRLRPHALVVDVSRGGVVEERAMLEAIRKGRLGGVGLDVFETEPLPSSSPLWTMPNVIVTPHVASASPRYWEQAAESIGANLGRLVRGEPLVDRVTAEWLRDARAR